MDTENVATKARVASSVIEIGTRQARSADRFGGRSVVPMPPAPSLSFELSADDSRRFVRIISQSLRIRRHYELFQLLQGDVQYYIPHQILIAAWGDFGASALKLDVVSALPGIRTSRVSDCQIQDVLRELYMLWLGRGRTPTLLERPLESGLIKSTCHCRLHQALAGLPWMLVHGVRDLRDGIDSLYVTASRDPIAGAGNNSERFQFLAETIVCQIDAAFHRVEELKRPRAARPAAHGLSAREAEVLRHVSDGRTNAEIARLLLISPFTVKIHVRQIMRKLGATNRTEAVSKHQKASRVPRD